jgi:hypothetical protein
MSQKTKKVKNENSGVIEALQNQLRDYKEKAEYFNTMKLKAEGALEVLLQLKDNKEEK